MSREGRRPLSGFWHQGPHLVRPRGGAAAGVCRASKAPCAENRVAPERVEAKQRISGSADQRISGSAPFVRLHFREIVPALVRIRIERACRTSAPDTGLAEHRTAGLMRPEPEVPHPPPRTRG